jgi:hypothetical protein
MKTAAAAGAVSSYDTIMAVPGGGGGAGGAGCNLSQLLDSATGRQADRCLLQSRALIDEAPLQMLKRYGDIFTSCVGHMFGVSNGNGGCDGMNSQMSESVTLQRQGCVAFQDT